MTLPRVKAFRFFRTYNSHKEEFESSGKINSLSYSLGFSRFDTEGIPQLKNTSGRDPYDNTSVSLRADYDLNQQNTVGIIGRFTDAEFDYKSEFEPTDPNLNGKEKQLFLSNYIDSKMNERWEQKLQLSYSGNYRRDFDDPSIQFPSNYLRDWYNGVNYQADWQNTIELAKLDSVVTGIDYQQEYGSSYYYSTIFGASESIFPEKTTHTIGYYFQNLFNIKDRFHLNTGIRLDDHSNFGLHQTYKIDSSYLFSTGTKIKGGWGTAFKAPTLYQLYAPAIPFFFNGGNPNLKPEESSTYEIGAEQSILNDKVSFGVTYFHTDTTNLIDAIYEGPPTFITDSYTNIGKARIFGYETTMTVKPVKQVKFDVGYTWQHTENLDTGNELLRRPENKYFSKIRYTPTDKLEFGLKVNYVGKREDSGNIALKAYTKVDLDASYKFNHNAELFVAIDNITSESYEEVADYAEPGRTFLGGLKFTF